MLDLAEFLSQIRQRDPILGLALESLQDSVNHLGIVTGNDPTGMIEDAPTPPRAMQVSAGGGLAHVTLTDTSARSRALHYFLEFDNDPSFPQPHLVHLGAAREALLPLPGTDSNGNKLNYYFRSYSMLPGSARASEAAVFGGQANPTAVNVGGAAALTLQAAPGSGTASPSGRQGGQGFGPTMLTPAEATIVSQVAQGANSGGQVTPGTFSAVGDGLIHGDAIWEIDPAFVCLRDDFLTGSTSTGTIGDLRWVAVTGSGTLTMYTGGPPNLGLFGISNTTIANQWFQLGFGNSSAWAPFLTAWPLLTNPPWKCVWVWKFDPPFVNNPSSQVFSMAKKSFYIGLGYFSGSASTPRPDIFIGVRYDTDTTAPAISDTTMKFEAVCNPLTSGRNNTQGTVVDTGITPSKGTYYRLEMTCTAVGVVTLSVNGSAPQSFTFPQAVLAGGTGSSGSATNGIALFNLSAPTGGWTAVPWTQGALVTISGFTGAQLPLDGTWTVLQGQSGLAFEAITLPNVANANSAFTATGYPSLTPWFVWGNDTEASPVTNAECCLDFFGFVWNPGVGGGAGTPDKTKPRYW